jgi:hypothetical protein
LQIEFVSYVRICYEWLGSNHWRTCFLSVSAE